LKIKDDDKKWSHIALNDIKVKEVKKGFIIIYEDDSWSFWDEKMDCHKKISKFMRRYLRLS